MKDLELFEFVNEELMRQRNNIELIASENFVSEQIMTLCGSILTNKYAEGYPNKRYYGGCKIVDKIEQIAIDRACQLFNAEHANVQPHSGSQANMAVYMAILNPHDKVLGMSLNDGGHLTHGHSLNFSGMTYDFYGYGVNRETEMIDYEEVRKLALEIRPKLIVAGASAYSRIIDFKKMSEIAKEVGAYFMVDMAHIAGLVATGLHPSPIPYADFVTTTTHKTLRGPRGGLILCKKEHAALLDKKVFPGMQGGPLMHIIAGKAACLKEAMSLEYQDYIKQVVKNAQVLSDTLTKEGLRIVSQGTDNHLLLVDVRPYGLTGKEAEKILDSINITCNKNSIPFDTNKPFITSGIRLGTPAMTTRGFKEAEFEKVALIIARALKNHQDEQTLKSCHDEVKNLMEKFSLYPQLKY